MNPPLSCPQFQTHMEEVPLRDGKAMVPIRRCLLSERMVEKLLPVPEAGDMVRAVVLNPGEEPVRCSHGPDMDIIEHSRCTADRCMTSCSPSYRAILSQFGLEDRSEIDCGAALSEAE